ncbi:glycosyltransferase [Salimicrobium sp. PL1-032A]|uniref:glycosyltransferase family 2 protein n=1 Tax=Salimicrobium sp. PL1-032A TaxID=3095364 RepID=UPI00326109D3
MSQVSIIVPVYNTYDYLAQCLDSLVNQTFKDIEILLINDGSTDSSKEICLEYEKNYSFISYYEQPNQGQGTARNNGLKKAKGKYVYFMDSDDLIDPFCIQILYKESEKDCLDLLLFEGESFLDKNSTIHSSDKGKFNYVRSKEYSTSDIGENTFVDQVENNDFFPSPCLLFVKKRLLDESGLLFYEGIIYEDALFTLELMLYSKRTKHIKKKLFHRRIRVNSTMTGENHKKKYESQATVVCELNNRYLRKIKDNSGLEAALNKRMVTSYLSGLRSYSMLHDRERKDLSELTEALKKIGVDKKYYLRLRIFIFVHLPWLLNSYLKFRNLVKQFLRR